MSKSEWARKNKIYKKKWGLCYSCKKKRAKDRTYCSSCLKNRNLYYRNQTKEKKKKGICTFCSAIAVKNRVLCLRCKDRLTNDSKKIKQQLVDLYGGKCACCGESEIVVLTLDHVNNDGAEERKQLYGYNRSGKSHLLYRKILREGKSDRYQILCYNCNIAKYKLGKCYHQ